MILRSGGGAQPRTPGAKPRARVLPGWDEAVQAERLTCFSAIFTCTRGMPARRTVAIEVGMQNCGMATGLAINVLKSAQIALPAAIFGPWMSISGAMLAAWWQSSAVSSEPENVKATEAKSGESEAAEAGQTK